MFNTLVLEKLERENASRIRAFCIFVQNARARVLYVYMRIPDTPMCARVYARACGTRVRAGTRACVERLGRVGYCWVRLDAALLGGFSEFCLS